MYPAAWRIISSDLLKIIDNVPIDERRLAYRPFTFFHPTDTRVIILGSTNIENDGLAYSTKTVTDITLGIAAATGSGAVKSGTLTNWALQGVLLLDINRWPNVTEAIVDWLMKNTKCVIFAWNNAAVTMTKQYTRVYCCSSPTVKWRCDHFALIKDINWKLVPNIKIFTDGGCKNNGKPYAQATYGAVFEGFILSKLSGRVQPFEYDFIDGIITVSNRPTPATNNRGELLAIVLSLQYITAIFKDANIELVVDSKYSKDVGELWMNTWVPGEYVRANMDLIKIFYYLSLPFNITYVHQFSHVKNPKTPNEIGNAMADSLTNEAYEYDSNDYSRHIQRVWEYNN